jgi:hypothetical protein
VASLAAKLNDIVQGSKTNSASFLVFTPENADALAPKLEELGKKHSLKIPLTLALKDAGVQKFTLSPDAWVTVLFYKDKKAEKTLAYPKAKFDAAAVDAILSEAKKQGGV